MLSAEAMRLAAIEALCPTAAIATGAGFPTLARHRVYDSQMIGAEGIDPVEAYTPSLSLYTEEVRIQRRGDAATSMRGGATAALVVIAELGCVQLSDDGPIVVPYGEDDPRARLVLAALCAQVRQTLAFSPAGSIVRSIVGAVDDIRIEPFAIPQFDIRWMRSTMTFTCMIRDDVFTDAAGLPEPLKGLFEGLPAGSYARGKLQELSDTFAGIARSPIVGMRISTSGDPSTEGPDAFVP